MCLMCYMWLLVLLPQVWAKRFKQLLSLVQEVEGAMGGGPAAAAGGGGRGGMGSSPAAATSTAATATAVSPEDLEPLLTLAGLRGSNLKVQYREVPEVKVRGRGGAADKWRYSYLMHICEIEYCMALLDASICQSSNWLQRNSSVVQPLIRLGHETRRLFTCLHPRSPHHERRTINEVGLHKAFDHEATHLMVGY
jgi:hypothetical protein